MKKYTNMWVAVFDKKVVRANENLGLVEEIISRKFSKKGHIIQNNDSDNVVYLNKLKTGRKIFFITNRNTRNKTMVVVGQKKNRWIVRVVQN